jgi:hypothetical protein
MGEMKRGQLSDTWMTFAAEKDIPFSKPIVMEWKSWSGWLRGGK